jgi:hypothetical protein
MLLEVQFQIYTKPLFYVPVLFLKKRAQIKEAKIKNDIPARNNGMGRG